MSRAFRRSSWSTAPDASSIEHPGAQPAAELARFYKAAAAKAQPPANSNAHVGDRERRPRRRPTTKTTTAAPTKAKAKRNDDADERDDDRARAETAFTNPKPWETVVRIRVLNNRSTGFGSGTIIHSTPEESLILTCAHIFKLEGRRSKPRRLSSRAGS